MLCNTNNMDACGLDFGTSNSTIGVCTNGEASLIPIDGESPTLKSAIFFCSEDNKPYIGQTGINNYFKGDKGRLMLSLKSILGSSLINEKTAACGKLISYQDIIGLIIHHIKHTAEQSLSHELTKVVLGRPVKYHDQNDCKDALAQTAMESIARAQGFTDIVFQYEPIAAALNYETTLQGEEVALIIDMGGGTSDFTIIKLHENNTTHDRTEDILANHGVHIGGTDFDRELSIGSIMPLLGKGSLMRTASGEIEVPSSVYFDLTTWHMLNFLYTHKVINNVKDIYSVALEKPLILRLQKVLEEQQGHVLLDTAEQAKIALSSKSDVCVDLKNIEENLHCKISRGKFEDSCHQLVDSLQNSLAETLHKSGLQRQQVGSIFLTGGTTQIPVVLEIIKQLFPTTKIIQGDIYGSVGKGLALEASRIFAY